MTWWKTEGVAGRTFNTKSALEEEIRRRINGAEIGAPLPTMDADFLKDVLRRHYDWESKKGEGINEIHVRLNYAYGNAQRGLWLIRADGSEIDISWRVPLMPGGMPKARLNVSLAARYEIWDQVAEARKETPEGAPCGICGLPLLSGGTHVDHAGEWPFVRILDAFFDGFSWDEIALEDVTTTQSRFVSRKLASEWQQFHAERAELVVIHAHENLSKRRKA